LTNAGGNKGSKGQTGSSGNNILDLLLRSSRPALESALDEVDLRRQECLFEPGDDVTHAYFPIGGAVVSLVLPMREGRAIEATTIGREGAVGGIVSLGQKPAFARAVVQIAGKAQRIPLARLEAIKQQSPEAHRILVRYADCLTAQVLQAVGCATAHSVEARCARWLLTAQDRAQASDITLTQEALAELFGVARTYLGRVARALQRRGAITYRRGLVRVERRDVLEEVSCECYAAVRRHYERVLPGAYPSKEP